MAHMGELPFATDARFRKKNMWKSNLTFGCCFSCSSQYFIYTRRSGRHRNVTVLSASSPARTLSTLIVASSSKRESSVRTTSGETSIGRPMTINSLVRVSHSRLSHTLVGGGEEASNNGAANIARRIEEQ